MTILFKHIVRNLSRGLTYFHTFRGDPFLKERVFQKNGWEGCETPPHDLFPGLKASGHNEHPNSGSKRIRMKKLLLYITTVIVMIASLEATPSSLFWTNCTTDIQTAGTVHLNVDNYFRVIHATKGDSAFPTDFGVTIGAFAWHNLQGEIGIDYVTRPHAPFTCDAKIGFEEDVLCDLAPSFNIGMFGIGTQTSGRHRTNENIVDIIFGKSLPKLLGGKFFLGFFSGSSVIGKNRRGVMVGYRRPLSSVKDASGVEYHKWVLCADYASGKNSIGGGGVALTYYFSPTIDVITGPVWFNDRSINGKWKWSVQIDCSL